jgi:hypothetical protein
MKKGSPAYILYDILPLDLVYVINSYLPKVSKKKKEVSPSMQKQLTKIQTVFLKGKCGMYMRELVDFCLD